VDVIDSEYSAFQKAVSTATDFQVVLKAHKNFIVNVLRLSLLDNSSIQEGIERILQVDLLMKSFQTILSNLVKVCLRFVAVCRLLHHSEEAEYNQDTSHENNRRNPKTHGYVINPPIYVPPEEFISIQKDFYSQVTFLFQIMRKVDSRGFMFRLDFNGFISKVAMELTLNPYK